MRRIIFGSAGVGFFLPLVMLAYYNLSSTGAGALFVTLCPTCMASMALDRASFGTAIIVWFFICVSNAFLYSVPALLLAMLVAFRHRT